MKHGHISPQASASGSLSRETAEAVAIDALSFLAGDPERLDRFMALCGLSPDNLRAAATSPGFLAGVLDYIAQDEPLLLALAEKLGCDPKYPLLARNCLDPPVEESFS